MEDDNDLIENLMGALSNWKLADKEYAERISECQDPGYFQYAGGRDDLNTAEQDLMEALNQIIDKRVEAILAARIPQ